MNNSTYLATGRSGSSLVLAFLQSLPPGAEFSSQSIMQALGSQLSSSGVVTGFLSKLKADGKITVVAQGRTPSGVPTNIYSIVDLEGAVVRPSSRGGKIGRVSSGVPRKAKIAAMLLDLAAQVEDLRGDLSDFSTHELLKELERRTRPQGGL